MYKKSKLIAHQSPSTATKCFLLMRRRMLIWNCVSFGWQILKLSSKQTCKLILAWLRCRGNESNLPAAELHPRGNNYGRTRCGQIDSKQQRQRIKQIKIAAVCRSELVESDQLLWARAHSSRRIIRRASHIQKKVSIPFLNLHSTQQTHPSNPKPSARFGSGTDGGTS